MEGRDAGMKGRIAVNNNLRYWYNSPCLNISVTGMKIVLK